MPTKRFRTRYQWLNTTLWALVSLGFVLIAIALSGMTGNLLFAEVAVALAVLGAVPAFISDRPAGVVYMLGGGTLILRRRKEEERVDLKDIRDASLVDRRAARDILGSHLADATQRGASKEEIQRMRRSFVKWCTVDIGLRTLTFGIGRDMIDRRPDAKHDLVLLRLRDGRALVLSPVYNQDLVESLNRANDPVATGR